MFPSPISLNIWTYASWISFDELPNTPLLKRINRTIPAARITEEMIDIAKMGCFFFFPVFLRQYGQILATAEICDIQCGQEIMDAWLPVVCVPYIGETFACTGVPASPCVIPQ